LEVEDGTFPEEPTERAATTESGEDRERRGGGAERTESGDDG
jgi:hypothetical protein